MTAVPVKQVMTADEYLARPLGEGPRWQELVEGEVIVNEPTALHNVVQTRLVIALGNWIARSAGRGQVFIPLDMQPRAALAAATQVRARARRAARDGLLETG